MCLKGEGDTVLVSGCVGEWGVARCTNAHIDCTTKDWEGTHGGAGENVCAQKRETRLRRSQM